MNPAIVWLIIMIIGIVLMVGWIIYDANKEANRRMRDHYDNYSRWD